MPYKKVSNKVSMEPIPWKLLTKYSDKISEDRKLTEIQQLKQIICSIDADIIRNTIIQLRLFMNNANISINIANVSANEMMFLSNWDLVVQCPDIFQMFDEGIQRTLDDIRYMLDMASGKFKLRVETVVAEHRSVKFIKVYSQTAMPLPDSAQSQPLLHSTQVIEPHSHSTQVIEPHLHSTQVAETQAHSTQVVEPYSHSTPVIKAHSQSQAMVPGSVDIDEFSNGKLPNGTTEELTSRSYAMVPRVNIPNQQTVKKFLDKTKNIPAMWIRARLLRIKRFLGVDGEASMVISPVTKTQKAFLQRCVTWLSLVKTQYDRNIQTLLKNIHDLVTENSSKYKVKISVLNNKVKGQYSPRKLLFVKAPCSVTNNMYVRYINKVKSQNVQAKIISDFKMDFLPETLKEGDGFDASVTESNVGVGAKRLKPPVDKVVKKRFKCGTDKIDQPAKDKLIEGLSQPVVSDKGIMMMREYGLGGWSTRGEGEGIAEPIKLPLDLERRAGLGSAKIPPTPKHTKLKLPANIMRKEISAILNKTQILKIVIQIVAKMQTSEFKGYEIIFASKVTGRNWMFVRDIVMQLNERGRMSVHATLTDLAVKVMKSMRFQGDYINALWGTSHRNILFILSKEIYQYKDLDNGWCEVINVAPTPASTSTSATAAVAVKDKQTEKYLRTDARNADIKHLQYCNEAGDKNTLTGDANAQMDTDDAPTGQQCYPTNGDNPTGYVNELTGKQIIPTGEKNLHEPMEHYFDVEWGDECVCCLPDYGYSDDDDDESKDSNASEFEMYVNNSINIDDDEEMIAENDIEDSGNIENIREMGEIGTDSEDELPNPTGGYQTDDTLGQVQIPFNKIHRKRLSNDEAAHERALKRPKYSDYAEEVSITPKDYPRVRINFKMAGEIQKTILEAIDNTKKAPLLKCHGIQNGALIYTCHSEKSYKFIKKIIYSLDLRCTNKSGTYKMVLKTNTFTGECFEELFQRIEMFNSDICTKDWIVIFRQDCTDIDPLELLVEMDEDSYKLIQLRNFSLNAGIDEVQFTVWTIDIL